MRVVFVLWAALALFGWLGLSLYKGQMQDFPASLAAIISALAVGKSVQRFAE